MNLTICDWQLAIAAYAYEAEDKSVMTDHSYDRMSREAHARNTQLPNFGADTGQWVHAMDQELLAKLLAYALSVNDGKDDLHGPAIRAALDHHGISYGCCIQGDWSCWDCVG